MTQREAFEAWAIKTICNKDDLSQRRLTGYGSQELNYLWQGYQAAQEQPSSLLRDKDSKRYMWLRVHGNKFFNAGTYQGTGLTFDASVDAAIAEQEGRPS